MLSTGLDKTVKTIESAGGTNTHFSNNKYKWRSTTKAKYCLITPVAAYN